MKIEWKDLVGQWNSDEGEDNWLSRIIMNCITHDVIEKAREKQYFDVHLVIDGVEHDPTILNTILQSIHKYIKQEAKNVALKKFEEAMSEGDELLETIENAKKAIQEKFNLYEDYDDNYSED